MDDLDLTVLLYLGKTWDGKGSLLDCYHTLQSTKAQLQAEIAADIGNHLTERINHGETIL